MCDPVSMGVGTMAVLSIGNEVGKISQQAETAKAMADRANDDLALQYEALDSRAEQVAESTQAQKFQRRLEQQREMSKINAITSGAGVSGNTPAKILMSSIMDSNMDLDVISANQDNQFESIYQQKKAAYTRADAIVKNAKNQMPTLLGSIFQIGGAGVSGAMGGAALGEGLSGFLGSGASNTGLGLSDFWSGGSSLFGDLGKGTLGSLDFNLGDAFTGSWDSPIPSFDDITSGSKNLMSNISGWWK